ncbi:hypothetical protein P256_02267 [Acinetobacter nectaris CIP 110549]|uniref:Uncharacterized protein n=1 Tax=Acinetobacter nectaris CIP 110549 TaxID=1392540 RepID=V2TJC8_9GAMM|nr:hypothetical protein [Acinetobacter nectaris]ESK37831.1 hypothetical protein P256_02267 [Acinetobacter nectaris CIP 110549]
MKTAPEQINTLVQHHHAQPKIKIDTGAICFFFLGIFMIAFLLHSIY